MSIIIAKNSLFLVVTTAGFGFTVQSTPKVKSMEETSKPSLSEGAAKERQPAETFNVEKEKETRTSKHD